MPLDIPQYTSPAIPGRIFSSFPELKEAFEKVIIDNGLKLTEDTEIPYEFLGYIQQNPDPEEYGQKGAV